MRRVVVTGLGVVLPIRATWNTLAGCGFGPTGIRRITKFDANYPYKLRRSFRFNSDGLFRPKVKYGYFYSLWPGG